MGEVDIVFGLPNIEEIQKEIAEKDRRIRVEDLKNKAHAFMDSDPNVADLFQLRIEMGNVHSALITSFPYRFYA